MKKSQLKTLLKIILSLTALIIVFHKIDLESVILQIRDSRIAFFLPAVVFFVVSKIISALRLNKIFKSFNIKLKQKTNLKLYWKGMFYNIFLPGSISGDLYKAYFLKRHYQNRFSDSFSAIVVDRVNGVIVLLMILVLPSIYLLKEIYNLIIPFGIIFIFIIFCYIIYRYFKHLFPKIGTISGYSLLVQVAQLIAAGFILYALNEELSMAMFNYLFVFLITSIAAVLPVTFGGMGAREITFVYLANHFQYDTSLAVSLALVFQLITLFVSLAGGIVTLSEKADDNRERS